jgi:hypothetical protein
MYTVLVSLLILLTAQAQTQNDLDAAGTEINLKNRPMCPQMTNLGISVPWTMRPLYDASLGRCVPWTMRPLDDALLG